MKTRFTWMALAIALCTHAVQAQLKGDTYAQAKETKKATWVITHSNSPGLAESNGGKNEGLCFDLMTAFAGYVKTKTGIEVTLTNKTENANDFTGYLNQVKAAKGGVFGLSNTTITAERKKSYSFSPPFIKNISMLLTGAGVADLGQMNQLSTAFAGFKAITVKGSTNEVRILDWKAKHFPALQVEYVSSFSQIIDRLASDPKTFADLDFTYFLKGIQAGKKIKRHPVGDKPGEEFGIIMPLSNDWSPLLAEFMNANYLASAEYNAIITKHLGQRVQQFIKKG